MEMTRRKFFVLLTAPAIAQTSTRRLDDLEQRGEIEIRAELDHVQGIDVRGSSLWITSVDRKRRRGLLHRIELPSGEPVAEVEVQRGERYHPGGVALDGDSLWVPVAEYKPHSSANIERRQADSLQLESSLSVDDHIGCVAVASDRVIGGNWDSERFYAWDRSGKRLGAKPRRTETHYQDLKASGDAIVASGNISQHEGAIDWLSLDDYSLQRRILAGETDRGVRFTNEGMAIANGKLYLLPEDGPSRLFVFQLPGSARN